MPAWVASAELVRLAGCSRLTTKAIDEFRVGRQAFKPWESKSRCRARPSYEMFAHSEENLQTS